MKIWTTIVTQQLHTCHDVEDEIKKKLAFKGCKLCL